VAAAEDHEQQRGRAGGDGRQASHVGLQQQAGRQRRRREGDRCLSTRVQLSALQHCSFRGRRTVRQLATHRPPCKSVSAVQGADLVACRVEGGQGDKVTTQ
jgi:hypothetical protein